MPRLLTSPPNGNAAEADTMIASLSPNYAVTRSLTNRALVGNRDLQGSIDGLRTRSRKEYTVKAGFGPSPGVGRKLRGEIEGDRIAHLKWRAIVLCGELALNGPRDFSPTAASVAAPKYRSAIQYAAAIRSSVIHALSRNEQTGAALNWRLAVKGIHKLFITTSFRWLTFFMNCLQ